MLFIFFVFLSFLLVLRHKPNFRKKIKKIPKRLELETSQLIAFFSTNVPPCSSFYAKIGNVKHCTQSQSSHNLKKGIPSKRN